jgi:hypothetical protein
MEIVLILASIILIGGGIIFSILPPLPGPLLTYAAMVCAHFVSADTHFSTPSFIIWAVIGISILIADYFLPVAATRRFGGTKAGVVGGMIGMVAGIVLPIPFGIVLGPLLGAIIGDLVGGNRIRAAIKSGFGSFIGFLVATGLKLLYAVALGMVIVVKVGGFTFNALQQFF